MRVPRLLVVVGVCALVVCLAAASVVSATEDENDVVSPRLQRIIQEDHQAILQMRANRTDEEEEKLGAIQASTRYSYAAATKLFWHSVTAYCQTNAQLQDWTCPSCKQFGPFTVTAIMDTQVNVGYVGYFTQGLPASPIDDGTGRVKATDPFVLISFRGTVPSDIKNWIENLSFGKVSAWAAHPDAKVHQGFWTAYSSLKATMLAGLKKALQASGATTIIGTGHSLGGAMSELALADLKLNDLPNYNYASYTQGTPRVGNAAFSSLYSSVMNVTFREVHQADVVPHLPPMLMDYQHPPMEIWFNEPFTSFSTCNTTMTGEQPTCSNSLPLPISIADHVSYRGVSMGGYCLQAQLAGESPAELPEEESTPIRKAPTVLLTEI